MVCPLARLRALQGAARARRCAALALLAADEALLGDAAALDYTPVAMLMDVDLVRPARSSGRMGAHAGAWGRMRRIAAPGARCFPHPPAARTLDSRHAFAAQRASLPAPPPPLCTRSADQRHGGPPAL